MPERIKECQLYIKSWYIDSYVLTVRMDGGPNEMDEVCIQTMVVELLRDFIDNPWPEGIMEGSETLNRWIDTAFRKVMVGLNFGFTPAQEDAVKNLAFNYYVRGICNVRNDPALHDRVFKCYKMQPTQH